MESLMKAGIEERVVVVVVVVVVVCACACVSVKGRQERVTREMHRTAHGRVCVVEGVLCWGKLKERERERELERERQTETERERKRERKRETEGGREK